VPDLTSCAMCIVLAGFRLCVNININIGIYMYTHSVNVYIIRVSQLHIQTDTFAHRVNIFM